MIWRLFFVFILSQNFIVAQNGAVHNGLYAIYETVNHYTLLKQKIPSTGFSETCNAEILSYPSIKLGYSKTAWGNLGFTYWSVWGIDFGAGLSYTKSLMNAVTMEGGYSSADFSKPVANNQTFFSFYQPGNLCSITDVGLNLHLDAGTLFYAGVELDAGPSRIVFTDNRIESQKVKSSGWFINTRVQGGISLPLPLRVDSDVKINLKMYAIFLGWSARTYKLTWTADDKKLKKFSELNTTSQPFGLGFSMSILLLQ